jgi:hypothetical protein
MARQEDVMKVRKDIEAQVEEAQGIQTKYQTYAQEVGESIKGILEEAGVFEEVNKLELERQEAAKAAQVKIDAVQAKLNELNTVLRYMEGNIEPPEAPAVEAKAEEAPAEEDKAEEASADEAEEAPAEEPEAEEAPVAVPAEEPEAEPKTPTMPQF